MLVVPDSKDNESLTFEKCFPNTLQAEPAGATGQSAENLGSPAETQKVMFGQQCENGYNT